MRRSGAHPEATEPEVASVSEEPPLDARVGAQNPFPGEDASAASAPSRREMAFLSFLFSRNGDEARAAKVREYISPGVFGHPFAREFVSAWLSGGLDGFISSLDGRRRQWFDSVFLDSSKAGESSLEPDDVLDDFIRRLWCDALCRRRGALPASDPAATAERMSITLALKRLEQLDAKEALAAAKTFLEQQETKEGTEQWT